VFFVTSPTLWKVLAVNVAAEVTIIAPNYFIIGNGVGCFDGTNVVGTVVYKVGP